MKRKKEKKSEMEMNNIKLIRFVNVTLNKLCLVKYRKYIFFYFMIFSGVLAQSLRVPAR